MLGVPGCSGKYVVLGIKFSCMSNVPLAHGAPTDPADVLGRSFLCCLDGDRGCLLLEILLLLFVFCLGHRVAGTRELHQIVRLRAL